MISENASLIASLTKMQLNLSISIVVHSYPSEELFKTVERLSKSIEFAKSSGALGRADLSIVSNTRKPLNKEALSKQLSFPGEIKLQNNPINTLHAPKATQLAILLLVLAGTGRRRPATLLWDFM